LSHSRTRRTEEKKHQGNGGGIRVLSSLADQKDPKPPPFPFQSGTGKLQGGRRRRRRKKKKKRLSGSSVLLPLSVLLFFLSLHQREE
jgi:hypothetical protein